jgi:hypothetical protein
MGKEIQLYEGRLEALFRVGAPRGLESAIRVFATCPDLARLNCNPVLLIQVCCGCLAKQTCLSSCAYPSAAFRVSLFWRADDALGASAFQIQAAVAQ